MRVSYENIYSNSNLDLYYGSNQTLYADWHGLMNTKEVKAGSLAIIEHMAQRDAYLLICDDRNCLSSWSESLEWLEREYMPEMIRKGIQKIAHIYSHEDAAVQSMNRFLEIPLEYDTQVFRDFNSASKWLIGYAYNPPLSEEVEDSEHLFDSEKIYFISKFNRKTIFQGKESEFESNLSLATIEKHAPKKHFMRVHKSYIVNVNKICELKYHAGGYYRGFFKDFGSIYVTISKLKARKLKDAIQSEF